MRSFVIFHIKLIFYGEELLASHPTPKLEDQYLSDVSDCLFNIFRDTFYIWSLLLHLHPEDVSHHGEKFNKNQHLKSLKV
jgi:hypothetical protein